jgi:hypothetical protein
VKRRLVTLAAAASLVLCIATVALWVRSYWAWDQVVCALRLKAQPMLIKRTEFNSNRGSMRLTRQSIGLWPSQPNLPPVGLRQWQRNSGNPYADEGAGMTGFLIRVHREEAFEQGLPRNFAIILPLWIPTLASAALPVLSLARWRRKQLSKRADRCTTCNYDLRATPDRCPECGAIPAAGAR